MSDDSPTPKTQPVTRPYCTRVQAPVVSLRKRLNWLVSVLLFPIHSGNSRYLSFIKVSTISRNGPQVTGLSRSVHSLAIAEIGRMARMRAMIFSYLCGLCLNQLIRSQDVDPVLVPTCPRTLQMVLVLQNWVLWVRLQVCRIRPWVC